jgi:hypothetical protein
MRSDKFRELWIILVSIKYEWPLETACHYSALLWALTHPAVVTVPNVLGSAAPVWAARYLGSYLRFVTLHEIANGVYVDFNHGAYIDPGR